MEGSPEGIGFLQQEKIADTPEMLRLKIDVQQLLAHRLFPGLEIGNAFLQFVNTGLAERFGDILDAQRMYWHHRFQEDREQALDEIQTMLEDGDRGMPQAS